MSNGKKREEQMQRSVNQRACLYRKSHFRFKKINLIWLGQMRQMFLRTRLIIL